jgi:hypothetical protein
VTSGPAEYFSVTLDNYVAELLPAVFCREELKQFCCDSFILNQALKRTWSVRLGVFSARNELVASFQRVILQARTR